MGLLVIDPFVVCQGREPIEAKIQMLGQHLKRLLYI